MERCHYEGGGQVRPLDLKCAVLSEPQNSLGSKQIVRDKLFTGDKFFTGKEADLALPSLVVALHVQ